MMEPKHSEVIAAERAALRCIDALVEYREACRSANAAMFKDWKVVAPDRGTVARLREAQDRLRSEARAAKAATETVAGLLLTRGSEPVSIFESTAASHLECVVKVAEQAGADPWKWAEAANWGRRESSRLNHLGKHLMQDPDDVRTRVRMEVAKLAPRGTGELEDVIERLGRQAGRFLALLASRRRQEVTYDEIGAEFWPEDPVMTGRIHRARNRLKNELLKYGFGALEKRIELTSRGYRLI